MNRSLHVLVALAAGLGAYALLIPPVAAASDVEPVPAVIVSYRTAVARAAPSVVTVIRDVPCPDGCPSRPGCW